MFLPFVFFWGGRGAKLDFHVKQIFFHILFECFGLSLPLLVFTVSYLLEFFRTGGCGDTLAVVHVIPSTLNPHVDLVLENMSQEILSKRTKYLCRDRSSYQQTYPQCRIYLLVGPRLNSSVGPQIYRNVGMFQYPIYIYTLLYFFLNGQMSTNTTLIS